MLSFRTRQRQNPFIFIYIHQLFLFKNKINTSNQPNVNGKIGVTIFVLHNECSLEYLGRQIATSYRQLKCILIVYDIRVDNASFEQFKQRLLACLPQSVTSNNNSMSYTTPQWQPLDWWMNSRPLHSPKPYMYMDSIYRHPSNAAH